MADSPRIVELQEKFEENPRRYFASLANEYRKAGDLQRAISICRIYLERQPDHTAGHVVLGQALYASGKTDEAKETFITVLSLDPENLIALRCLGDIAADSGDLQTARDSFRFVLTADPRDQATSGRLKAVEQSLKIAASGTAGDWIPPRSEEFPVKTLLPPVASDPLPSFRDDGEQERGEPPLLDREERPTEPERESVGPFEDHSIEGVELAEAAPDDSPHHSFEVENLPALEEPAVHEDVPDDDFVGTLLPSSETEHQPALAEPVALESAEDTLAVPDLLKEADFLDISVTALDESSQYRTAEYSLPKNDATENESVTESESEMTTTEMESEAAASVSDAEGPFAPEPPFLQRADEVSSRTERTGEFSLAENNAEWYNASGESAASAREEHSDEFHGIEPAGPFITETVAELYLQQGFTGEALLVYRQLARSKPGDQRIADRIAVLEERLAEEHAVRQAALDTHSAPAAAEPATLVDARIDAAPEKRQVDLDDFDRAWAPSPPPPTAAAQPAPASQPLDDLDDWFATPDVAPVRARQTVQEFFAILRHSRAGIRRKPERIRVSADEIRDAVDITAGFGAFGIEPRSPAPKSIGAPRDRGDDPQGDVLRFRSWLDGLSDS